MNGLEIYQNVLTPDQCNQLIKLFGDDDRKESGKILSPEGLREDSKIKTSTDIQLNFLNPNDKPYNDIILEPLARRIGLFKEKYAFLDICDKWDISGEYNIQRYNDGEGFFKPHCEQGTNNPYRMLAWMIYLTDSISGTEFPYQNVILEAKKGNLAIWSAGWTHPHKGQTPNVGIKYIITGWCHFNNNSD